MLQRVLPIALVACLVAPRAAQAPAGMKMRVDRSTDASDPDNTPDVKVAAAGKGFRVTGGPAVVLWNPTNAASGNFSLKGTFTLMKPSSHPNFYGLVFGGSALDGAAQAYTYFTVAQNGSFLIKQRNGDQTPTVSRGQHASVKTPDANGTAVNTLEVRVAGDTITYLVNDQTVHTMPKGTMKTDGLVGVRINHVLDVQVDGFALGK